MLNGESKWTVIANGKSIANGTTFRKNGVVSHFVTSCVPERATKTKTADIESDSKVTTKDFPDAPTRVDENSVNDQNEKNNPVLRVNTSCTRAAHEALTNVLQQLKWKECKGNFRTGTTADMYWHGPGFDEGLYNKVGVYAVNKLPGMVVLSQKVHLSKVIRRMQMLFPGEFEFYPPTWLLPEQYHQFVAEASMKSKARSSSIPPTSDPRSRRECHPTYIVKPDCGSQGEGIYLVNDPRDVQDTIGSRPAIVQRYIDNPLLLDKFKFDLRMYVAISRLYPIEIYLCKDGLARLCTTPYEPPHPSNIQNTFMHLTNYSLNKFSDDFVQTNAEHTGSKRTYRGVRQILRKQGYDVEKIHQQIVDLVVKTVLSLIPDITIWDHVTNRSKLVRSFQILGFDILLTSDLRAHLLEVNSSPSMGIDVDKETEPGSGILESVVSAVDEQIKVPLLRDVLRLIAYGEGEINMEKSCLQRVYPPCSKTSSQHSPRHQVASVNKRVHSDDVKRPSTNQNPAYFKEKFLRPLPDKQCTMHRNKSSAQTPRSRLDFDPGDKGFRPEGFSTGVGIKGNDFDNPLLRGNVTPRQHYPAKRPKRFTVVKYRQEYAISTEEWRLFQLRARVYETLPSRPKNSFTPRSSQPSLTPRSRPHSMDTEEVNDPGPVPLDKIMDQSVCRVCGHYIEGVGPGLYYTQQEYNAAQVQKDEQNGRSTAKADPWCQKSSFPQEIEEEFFGKKINNTSSMDWEHENIIFCRSPLPPRSIYFSSAQHEGEEGFLLDRRVKPLNIDEKVHLKRAPRVREMCESCIETSTTSSSSEEFSYKGVRKATASFKYELKVKERKNSQQEHVENIKSFSIREIFLVKRAAAVFIFFNGIKPSLRISATAFRNMARKCHLCDQGAMPAIDILFIDILRQWQRQMSEHGTPYYDSYRCKNPTITYQTTGLPFQGFLEALFRIAKARFKGSNLKEKMEALMKNCEQYIKEVSRAEKIARKKKQQLIPVKQKVISSPRISCSFAQRQPYF